MEVIEEFRHFHNLYHDRHNDRYIQVDERGGDNLVVEVSADRVRAKTRYVRQFIASRGLHLAVYFDHRAEAPVEIAAAKAKLPDATVICDDLRFSFHVGDFADKRAFSRLIGKKIISPLPVDQCGIWPYGSEPKKFVNYIIGVNAYGKDVDHTCNPDDLANYFGLNEGAPHFLAPVWFTRDVLRKYYDHPEKYSVEDGYLRCGSLWGLRMDNDLPSHVAVFLGDLGQMLAYEEQTYWKSSNVPPASNELSETNFRRSFLAQFANPTAPDLVLKQKLADLQEAWEQRYGWQLFRQLRDDDAHVLKQLRIPLVESMGEFEHQVLLLAKLLIDSLNDEDLVRECGSLVPDEKSISKLERFFEAKRYPHKDRDLKLLRLLQSVRSTGAAHRKGERFQKVRKELGLDDKVATDVFRDLLSRVNDMFADLHAHFIPMLQG